MTDELQTERVPLNELARVHAIRFEVFVGEQGVRADEERDDRDREPGAVHVLATARRGDQREDVGTARLLEDGPGIAHVSRVAVRRIARGMGVGRALMDALEGEAVRAHTGRVSDGCVQIVLSAQESALVFYSRLGYMIDEARYLDAGIWHRDATKIVQIRN